MIRFVYRYIRGLLSYLYIINKGKRYNVLLYRELYYVSFFSKNKFVRIKSKLIDETKKRISNKDKCKVGFVVYTASMWSVDGLYRRMLDDVFFDPAVLVVPHGSDKVNEETKKYFLKKGYNTISYDEPNFEYDTFDIIIYTNPYVARAGYLNLLSLKLDKLVLYVSYSYMLSDKIEKLDMPIYFLSWMFFCDSEYYKKLVETQSNIYTNNALFCGYPKMDEFYIDSTPKTIKKNGKKVIIYAPHQSVNYVGPRPATFDKNGWFLLYLAEKYKDKIYWIIKPHPLLRQHSVEAGIFNTENDYDDYLRRWEETGSAKVLENGDYIDLFKESDAMMTDSVSFLAEYQYTGKPLLMIESGSQKYNEFGNSIREILYRCKGCDYIGMEQFAIDTINENDPMKETRKAFFLNNISYEAGPSRLACQNMYVLVKDKLQNK